MFTSQYPVPTMLSRLRGGLAASLLFVVLVAPAFGQQSTSRQPPTEQQKIDYLVASVASLHDAVFIRNGTAYDASQAAAHMRLKLRLAGSHVKTADDFITRCATGSSATGVHYTIRFTNGPTVDAATWLRGKLAVFDADSGSSLH